MIYLLLLAAFIFAFLIQFDPMFIGLTAMILLFIAWELKDGEPR